MAEDEKDGRTLIEAIPTSHYIKFYSNNAQVQGSIWDVKISFNEVVRIEPLEEGRTKLIAEQHATVTMSPQHAKALLKALDRNIKAYESKFGEIVWLAKEE